MVNQILFLSANPSGSSKIKVKEECNSIDEKLRSADFGRKFKLEQRHAVSLSELSGYLQRFKPNIVHFSGHGSAEGKLVFQNAEGKKETVSPAALANLFRILNDDVSEAKKIRCVILNACFSDKQQATAIAKHVDCVIGISDAIGDEGAITFASHFYQALGYGHSIKKSFELGCAQLGLESNPDENIIKLEYRGGINPAQVYLVAKRTSKARGSDPVTPAKDSTDDDQLRRLQFYKKLNGYLADSLRIFRNQCDVRDQLVLLLRKDQRFKHHDLQYEQMFMKFHKDMNTEQLKKFRFIRQITEDMSKYNQEMLTLLRNNNEFLQEGQELVDLLDHLEFWLAKYRSQKDDQDMCLVYTGVEEGKGFPPGIQRFVSAKNI